MNDRTTEAGPPTVPTATGGDEGGSAPTPPPPSLATGQTARHSRRAALEAGQLFHRIRTRTCDLALAAACTHSGVADELFSDLIPTLIGTLGEMLPSAAGEVERRFGPWLRDLIGEFDGKGYTARLQQAQEDIDALTGEELGMYDLDAHRARLLGEIHDEIDDGRKALLAGVPEEAERAFRLGELLEMGAFPLTPVPHPPWLSDETTLSSSAAGAPITFGTPAQDLRPVLIRPPAVAYDQPWSPWWPQQVQRAWAECGLYWSDALLPADFRCPDDAAARQRVVETLVERAEGFLTDFSNPPLALKDRFRVQDELSRTVFLDGRSIFIEDRKAFKIVMALLDAPDNELSGADLNKLNGLQDADISKVLKKLPAELRKVIRATRGTNAVYHIELPRQTRR